MDLFLDRERIKAMVVICKAFRIWIQSEDGVDEVSEKSKVKKFKKGRKACVKWLEDHGVGGDDSIDTKSALSIFTQKSSEVLKKVDIKGQIH
jgi:hypothetical protein